jgi:hypothetical protein
VKSFGQTYSRLVLASLGTAVAVGLLGYYPTLRIAGSDGVAAMFAGIGISLVAGCVGAIPIGLAGQGDPSRVPQAILLATAVRFLVVMAITISVVFSGWFERAALGLWIGIAYLAMLFVDTLYAVRVVGKMKGNHS